MSTTIKQAIDGVLLNCKVEGKPYGTIDCYADKLKGFLWYATNYDWPDDILEITTQQCICTYYQIYYHGITLNAKSRLD